MNTNSGKTGIIDIPGALHSTGGDGDGQIGGVVAYTGDIYDDNLNRNQADINKNMLVLDENHNLLINKDFIDVEGSGNILSASSTIKYTLSGSNSQYELKLYGQNNYQNLLGYQFVKFLEGSKILNEGLTVIATITNATYNSSNKKITITTDIDLGELNGEEFNMLNQSVDNKSFCLGKFINKNYGSTLIGNDNYNTGIYCVSLGNNNVNNGFFSLLIGSENAVKSDTDQCYIVGEGNVVNDVSCLYTVGGYNTSTGDNLYSFCLGAGAKFTRGSTTGNDWITQAAVGEYLNISQNEFVIGQYNKDYDIADSSKRNFFVVGNGNENTRANSLEQKANGDLYIKGIGNFDGTNSNVDTTKSLQSKINDLQTQIDNVNVSNFYTKSEIDAQNVVTSTALNDLNDKVDTNESAINDHFTDNNSIKIGTAINVSGTDSIAGGAGINLTGNRTFGYGTSMGAIYLTGNNGSYSARLYNTSNYDRQNNVAEAFTTTHLNSYLLNTSNFSRAAKITNIVYNGENQPLTLTLDTDLGELTNAVYAIENVAGTKSFNAGCFGNTGQNSSVIGLNNFNTGTQGNILGSVNANTAGIATILGYLNKNNGNYSNILGSVNNNSAIYSNVIGLMNTNDSTGTYANIIGRNNTNKCSSTSIIGIANIVNETTYPSVITGYENIADVATQQFTLGYGNHGTRGQYAEGNASASWMIGHHLTTSSGCWALGKYNKDYDVQDIPKQNFFVIGQGNTNAPLNSVELKRNGNLYIFNVGGFNGTNSDNANVKTLQTVINELQNTITSLQSRITALENQLNSNNA